MDACRESRFPSLGAISPYVYLGSWSTGEERETKELHRYSALSEPKNGASHEQGDRQESRAYNSSLSLKAETEGTWTYVYISFSNGVVNIKEKNYYCFQVTYQ